MDKKIKHMVFLSVGAVIVIFFVLFAVYINTPTTVLEYTSENKEITVLITQSKNFDMSPSRNQDYTITVKNNSDHGKTILEKDFNFYADSSGIGAACVDVKWNENSVIVTIDSKEMNKKVFRAQW